MSTNHYFAEIGAWPSHVRSLARAYAVGFVLSLVLTITAYFLTTNRVLPEPSAIVVLLVLACVQFIVQLLCFLHLDSSGSRERLVILLSALVVVLILVSGSLWIMFNLNQRMMGDPAQMEQYMNAQQGI